MGKSTSENWTEINRALWNQKTGHHVDSDFYAQAAFMKGASSLQQIELKEVGEVRGKSLLHLQCHFGQDTLSWARLGAEVTGVDLSDESIKQARSMADELEIPARFLRSNLYDLPEVLEDQFDIVFTSYGTIGWLPDLDRWAAVIRNQLKPGGYFYMAEFHPFIWMYDYQMEQIKWSYFNTGPIVEEEEGTYTDRTAAIKEKSVGWNHSTSDVINALLNQGLQLEFFNEYSYSPYPCFERLKQIGERKWVFEHLEEKIPYVFSLKASFPKS